MWYLNLPIPSDLRHLYVTSKGVPRTHIVEALGTSDLVEADYRKKRRIADLEKEFRVARNNALGILPSELDIAREFRLGLREILAKGDDDDHHGWYDLATEQAMKIAGTPDKQTPESVTRGDTFWEVARGGSTLIELFDEWASMSGISGRTLMKYRTAFKEFMDFMKLTDGLPNVMTRAAAVGYVDWLNKEGRSQRTKAAVPLSFNTKKDRVAALSAFWNGIEKRGAVNGTNPWTNLQITEKPTSDLSVWSDLSNVGRPQKRSSFSNEDLLAILSAKGPSIRRDCQHSKKRMLEVFALALLTGARLEEICCRRLKDLSKVERVYWLTIHDSKNESSDRRIPFSHPTGVALIDRLVGDRVNGNELLFEALNPAKTDGTYARNIGKALQRFFSKIPALDSTHVPYCARHTFQTLMGNREDVKDAVLDRYVGHANRSMMDRHYRQISDDALLSFAKKVCYADSVESRLREELDLQVN